MSEEPRINYDRIRQDNKSRRGQSPLTPGRYRPPRHFYLIELIAAIVVFGLGVATGITIW